MDGKQLSGRPSALPRPQSKLPMPRSTGPSLSITSRPSARTVSSSTAPGPRLRSTTSQESVGRAVEIKNSRLRPSASREQLQSNVNTLSPSSAPRSQSAALRRVVSKPNLSRPAPQTLRTQISVDNLSRPTGSLSKKPSRDTLSRPASGIQARHDSGTDYISSRHPLSTPRRPSQQFQSTSAAAFSPSSADDGEINIQDSGTNSRSSSRPSLNERTIDTLSRLPSSPALSHTGNSFYSQENRCSLSGSRSGSSHHSDDSVRPGSGSGGESAYGSLRPPVSSFKQGVSPLRPGSTTSQPKRVSSAKLSSNLSSRSSLGLTPSRSSGTIRADAHSQPPTPDKTQPVSRLKLTSKKDFSREPNSKLTLSDMKTKTLTQQRTETTQYEKKSLSANSNKNATSGRAITTESLKPAPAPVFRKSSAALREQIAKAKAANKSASRDTTIIKPSGKEPVIPTDNTFDFGLSDDPFNLKRGSNAQEHMIEGRIKSARTTGRLNIAAMNLKEIPNEVLKMYDLESIGQNGSAWAESVDLTKVIAADNELETIDDAYFPDCEIDQMEYGSIFAGLESLDLHGNVLSSVPIGIRRLQMLTSLNLSSNKLEINCFESITQISSLRDLKLSKNLLCGHLPDSFVGLVNLEVLDISNNEISAFPSALDKLKKLRFINVAENQFESLPFEVFSQFPLSELNARKNRLKGTLIEGVASMDNLQTLDISGNQLTRLVPKDSTIEFSCVQQLSLSRNRFRALPDVRTWKNLINLAVDENHLTEFPTGIFQLSKLRHADFSSNDIRVIPSHFALMDSLITLRIAGNPLREKKFASMSTEEVMASLAAKLERETHDMEVEEQPIADPEIIHYHERLGRQPASYQNIQHNLDTCENTEEVDDDSGPKIIHYHERINRRETLHKGSTTIPPQSQCDEKPYSKDSAMQPASMPETTARTRARTGSSVQNWPVKAGVLDRSKTQSSSLHPVVCSRVAAEHRIYEVQTHHNLFSIFPNSLSFFADTLKLLNLSHNQFVGESYLTEELDLPALQELNLTSNHITSLIPLMKHLRAPSLKKLDVSMNRIVVLPCLRKEFPSLVILLVANNHLEQLDPESIRGMEVVDASSNDIAHLNPKLGLLGGSRGTLRKLEVTGNRFRVPRWNVLERGTEATLKWLRSRVSVAEMAEWKNDHDDGNSGSDYSDLN